MAPGFRTDDLKHRGSRTAGISQRSQHRRDLRHRRIRAPRKPDPLRGLAWDVGLPVVTYYALHLLGATDWVALLASALVAGLRLGLGRGEAAQSQPVRHRDAAGVRARPGAHLRQRGPAVPAGQGVVRDRGGGPDVPGHRAARAPAADPGRAAELASRSGRRAGRRVPGRPGRAARAPARVDGVGRGPAGRGGAAGAAGLPAADQRDGRVCRPAMAVLAFGGLAVWTGRYSARARAAAARRVGRTDPSHRRSRRDGSTGPWLAAPPAAASAAAVPGATAGARRPARWCPAGSPRPSRPRSPSPRAAGRRAA